MRHEVLRTLGNPGEVTDAKLFGLAKCGGEHEPRRVGERAGLARGALGIHGGKALLSQLFGDVEVKTEEFTAISAHVNILTLVEMLFPILKQWSLLPAYDATP